VKSFRGERIPYFDRRFLDAYGCAEYCFTLSDQFRFVPFADGAYVGERFCRLDGPFCCDTGVQLRIFVMRSPLRLIFGYPITGDQFQEKHVNCNFTFGTTLEGRLALLGT
jgi:outer membrane protein assembly factor BamA